MTSDRSLEWLFSTQQFGIKLGLENTRRLLAGVDHPQEELAFIHVAGTNGKGSVCAMMDAMARATGRKTGLYTSPHLVDFRERIRVNGEKIPTAALAGILTTIRHLCEGWEHPPTFFEITTAIALRHFADEKCELVILETGMGGRLDSTNAVTPLVSLITPISHDHQQYLGETLSEIAQEKAGIIKPGVPVLSAPQAAEALNVLLAAATAAGSSFQVVENPLENVTLSLSGSFQKTNAALAVEGLRSAGVLVPREILVPALENVKWPGRFQIVKKRTILDGGHNPAAMVQLVQNWLEHYGEEKAVIIFGALADKDCIGMLRLLTPIAQEFVFVPVRSQRSADLSEWGAELSAPYRLETSLSAALSSVENARERVLITGSLFLVGEAMELLGIQP